MTTRRISGTRPPYQTLASRRIQGPGRELAEKIHVRLRCLRYFQFLLASQDQGKLCNVI